MGWGSTASIKDTATRMALQKFFDKLAQDKVQTWAGLIITGKINVGSFGSPIDVTSTRKYGVELHYSGNDYDVTGIRSRASLITTDTTASAQGGLFQAANNDNINVGVLNGLVAEAIGKATTNAATISTMRGALIGAEWSAKDTVTDLRTLHVRTHTRDAATEGYFSNSGYGIYIENEAVGGNGQALDAGIYFKDTNISGGNKAFTYGIDFSGGTFATAEIRLSNGETISNLIDGVIKFSGGGLWIDGTTGDTPASGAGTRLMWIPSKYAFRAGFVSSTQWDADNIGLYSTAMGSSVTASGTGSVAMGGLTTVSGNYSVVMGIQGISAADYSVVMGRNMQLTSDADRTFAFGYSATAVSIVQPDTFFLYANAFQMCNATTGVAATDGLKISLSGADATINSQDGDLAILAGGGDVTFGDADLSGIGTLTAEQLTSTDDITATDSFFGSTGLAASPTYSFTGYSTVGIYLAGPAVLGFSTDGLTRLELEVTGAAFYVPISTAGVMNTLTLATGSITDSSGAISFGNENLSTSGTLGAGAITGTSFIIGGNTLTTTEWAFLDGQNQALKTTDDVIFASARVNQDDDLNGFKVYGYDNEDTNYLSFYINDGGSGVFNSKENMLFTALNGSSVYFRANAILFQNQAASINFLVASGSGLVSIPNKLRIGSAVAATVALDVTGEAIVNEKTKLTSIGGCAIKLTNTTGAVTVAGQTVKADTATDDAVILTAADDDECIGVFLDSGIADDAEAWVVVAGIADVAMGDNEAATHGNWVETNSAEAGYADATAASPAAAPQHFNEIGHCMESVAAGGGGTHILARCVLHFN